ncbi:hypothetical protein [Streptomyces variabilis]
MSNTVLPFPSSLGEVLASADAAATNRDVARARARITVGQALEAAGAAAVEPLGGIISADARHTNEDVERTRRHLTVEQAAHMAAVADQLAAESADRYIAREFPAVAALLAADAERPRAHVLEADAAGHFPWCAPGKCTEVSHSTGDTTTEHVGAKVELPVPPGLRASLSAELYENSEYGGPSLSLACAGEGVPLDAAGAGRVIEDLAPCFSRACAPSTC